MKTSDKKKVLKDAESVMDKKEKGLVLIMREHEAGIYLTTIGGCSTKSIAMMIDDIISSNPQVMQAMIALKVEEMMEKKLVTSKKKAPVRRKVAPKKKK
jgi:hypothetical protein